MVVGVDPALAVVEMRWWDPFGVAVRVFAGGPALFGEVVVGAAGQGEVVDFGDGVGGVGVAVVGFAEVGGHGAARERAAAVFGMQVTVVRPSYMTCSDWLCRMCGVASASG